MKICTRAVVAAVPACALAIAAHGDIMLGVNLLGNSDAEAGPGGSGQVVPIPEWSVTEGLFTVAAYGADTSLLELTDPGPASPGNNYFTGGVSESSVAEQRYNLFPFAAAIDNGQLTFELEGWLGSGNGDLDGATLSVTFLDAGLAEISTFSIGPGTRGDSPSGPGLTFFDTDDFIPLGAREAVVELSFLRSAGGSSYNDGAADNLSFVILPSPGPLALFGLAGVIASARRR